MNMSFSDSSEKFTSNDYTISNNYGTIQERK